MKKIIFLVVIFLMLFLDSNVYAVCDTADINRLKEIANGVEVTYEHNVYGSLDEEDGILMSVYDIVVTGLTNEIYIVDGDGNKYHYYDANENGVINMRSSSGERKIFIFSETCSGILLSTKTLNLPTFNFNSISEECKKEEFKNLDICKEFLDDEEVVLNGDEFEEVIEEVKKEQSNIFYKIFNFIKNNLLYVSIGLASIIVISVILFLRYRKRSVLE